VCAASTAPGFRLGQVLDWCSGTGRGPQGLRGLAERDQGDVLVAAVGQERLDRGQPQRGRPGRVVALLVHPGQPGLQVDPAEVLEADLGAVDALGLGQVAKEALQADPVGLDRFRGQPARLG